MAIDIPKGEVELKRVKESEIARNPDGTRQHPVQEGQRWVYDRCGDTLDRDPGNHEWVLLGPETA